ncbi:kinase-like protein [Metschnikowia bicuspidata]|uniref:Kinase-like protein n=1 Tax=Metschnikowia bicuspidata TaxID=27322 RepID=A0A4P9ZIF0_9ASCO|nr:kinase-like protein [Metschnikowia bicuspidata]
MSDQADKVLSDIKGKIDREVKLIQGFQALKKSTSNPDVIQRCNNQIRETQSNIEYLQRTFDKLALQSAAVSGQASLLTTLAPPLYLRFDLIKYDCPSLGHKIQYMHQQLQFKLQVENQYRAANQRISDLYLMDGDKSSSSAAEGGKLESDQRIQLLNRSLKKYQGMHVSVDEVSRDLEIMNTPKYARKPLSGKLIVTVTCIRDVDHITSPVFNKKAESVVALKIDDFEKVRTALSRTNKFNEDFTIPVDKANELEITVYDKSGAQWVPVALTWILLSDIAEEIRKKKVANEMGSDGWIPASHISSLTFLGPTPTISHAEPVNFSESSLSSHSKYDEKAKSTQVSTWLNLEPAGQILVTLTFEKSNNVGRSALMGALGRHGAIRQKKEEVFEQHGHQFVQKLFYNIMCCALCGEFLRYTGFQCQDCRLLCHKKCYEKVVTKCISKSGVYSEDEANLNHHIPHRFEAVLNRGTKWCCHCGHILPWGRKNVRKCSECGVMCHAQCTHLVPDFCGMSMEMANKILTTIKSTKNVKMDQPASHKRNKPPPLPTKETSPAVLQNQNAKLSTQNSMQFQETVQPPYKQALPHRRTEPSEEYQYDYGPQTRGHQHPSEANEQVYADLRAIPQLSNNPFKAPAVNESFQKLNYKEVEETTRIPEEDRLLAQNPVVEEHRSHKSRKRRRKIGLDDFQFLAVLGKGNFGKVMLAELRQTSKLCAIKVLKKDFIVAHDEAESVKSEKRVFLVASHGSIPFFLNLHCCFQTENRIYFVMEYVSGGDLMWHIQKNRFSARRAKFYACEVLSALDFFHKNGIVYRDLKLDNILLTPLGHIKLGDYGLCKENMWEGCSTSTFCGTPEFMAPEIIANKPYDRVVDWWAFGVLMFQMMLCQSPFKGDDEDDIFNAIEHDEVRYPVSMPRVTVVLLQALLTKDPTQRLGAKNDGDEVMQHPYFEDVDFEDVRNLRIQPPYVPELTSEHDFSNFDQEFTSETPRLTPVETVLTSEMQEQFRGFSHISDNALV